jgi:hypothetical protein
MIFRTSKILVSLLLFVLVGCSKTGVSKNMTGDLVPFVLKCVTARGASPITNGLPELQAQWVCQSEPTADVVIISGSRFDEVQAFLKRAFGEPDRSLVSPSDPSAGGRDLRKALYGVNRIGVGLILADDSKNTMICIIGDHKP